MSNQELIVVKQLPIIEEQLKSVSKVIDEKIKKATSLICTEETVKTIKELRAELNKEFKELETQRKTVKTEVLKPYNDFEDSYKKYISDKFKNADLILKGRIEVVENEIKKQKEQEIKDYFEEYKKANNIDFVNYGQAKINVTLTASKKSLKEQVKEFIDKIVEDLKLIDTEEYKTEILVEYKQSLNVSQAITSVRNKNKAIEEEKKKQEESIKEASKSVILSVEENKEILQAPVEEKTEEILTLRFTVRGTKTKLKALKEFLINGGYDYE